MTDHPLTDEICADILPKRSFGLCNLSEIHLNTRVLGEVRHCNDMRAAADWQLEQVIEWLETALEYDPELANTRPYIHLDLKEAMRPQEDNQ